MALFILARRVQRTIQHLVLPLTSRANITNTLFPSSSSSYSLHHLCLTSQQTLGVHFHPVPNTPHFSRLHASISGQDLYDPIDFNEQSNHAHKPLEPDLLELFKRVKQFPSECETMAFLDESGVILDSELVCSAIWALRDEWRLAFLVFKWGDKCECCNEIARNLIIWVLGSCKKFNIAWCLIRDLNRSSVDIRQEMFIMIDRYAAANEPCKAIRAYDIMENFRMSLDVKAFYTLLSTLCKHGNIEEAEEFMLQNIKLFPLETAGFNVILNGWCNISLDVFEAKRIWREMSKRCVTPDATSYTHMISCFSKVGNLFDSLRLYDEMRKKGWVPGREVYNSLIYILSRENCLKEALKILEKMKEMGLQPDYASYNSMIRPLCEAKRLEEARIVLETMIEESLNPTIETYHAFLEEVDFEGTLEVLNCMKKAHLSINGVTFLLTLNRFLKLEQPENVLKIWTEMKQYVVPNSSHYAILVQGLAGCGWLIKAREFYAEMVSNGLDDPKLKKLLKEQERGNSDGRRGRVRQVKSEARLPRRKVSTTRWKKGGHQSKKQTSFKESNLTPD